jgi:diguanylate cyclase (GGDEF)-like protein
MALPNIPSAQLRTALNSLEQAHYNHDQWADAIYGTLVCRLTPDERDLVSDSHHRCRFGQWYYEVGLEILGHHPGFEAIGIEHERMHQYATTLLRSSMDGEKVQIQNYEHFVTARKRLVLETATLQHELDDALYNLDPLTGTTSRIGMLTKLRDQQELVKREVQSCVVAMMDLDHFKSINDKYGHIAGDKVLINIAGGVMAHLRPYDKVFRYGGEEFLISLPDTDLQTGHKIIDRLREELGSLPHEANGNAIFRITVSFGLTLLAPDIPVEQSIDRADKALYVAKETGRNRVVDWDASMDVLPRNPD